VYLNEVCLVPKNSFIADLRRKDDKTIDERGANLKTWQGRKQVRLVRMRTAVMWQSYCRGNKEGKFRSTEKCAVAYNQRLCPLVCGRHVNHIAKSCGVYLAFTYHSFLKLLKTNEAVLTLNPFKSLQASGGSSGSSGVLVVFRTIWKAFQNHFTEHKNVIYDFNYKGRVERSCRKFSLSRIRPEFYVGEQSTQEFRKNFYVRRKSSKIFSGHGSEILHGLYNW